MRGYWDSPAGLTQAHWRRFERTARIRVDQEPRSKTSARARDLMEFRRAVRDEVRIFRDWPRPRAALALDFFFRTTRRQPPALWALPKHYLDLCGATSAPEADPGPVLFGDDRQVKMLFASCVHAWQPAGTGPDPSIEIVARSRSDFLADMDLTDRLLFGDFRLEIDEEEIFRDDDPLTDLADTDPVPSWPAELRSRLRFYDQERRQSSILKVNDRLLRTLFHHDARWLLTGVDPLETRLLSNHGRTVLGEFDQQLRSHAMSLLDRSFVIDLPPLPGRSGESEQFRLGVRQSCEAFLERYPLFHPLLVPLRVTLLLIPPQRPAASTTDLDNIARRVLPLVEEILKPHPEPWLLAPDPARLSSEADLARVAEKEARLARLKALGGSAIAAYQALELHREAEDPQEGKLVIVPGHGWNARSLWEDADDVVHRLLDALKDRGW